MGALSKFTKGTMRMPVHWRLWLMVLLLANLIVPLFFLDRLEARVVIGVFLASAVLMTVLTGLAGFTRLLGLGHILWFPLLYFLWTRLGQHPASDAFGIWIRALMVINAVSLVLDVADVSRYFAGDREETVKGL